MSYVLIVGAKSDIAKATAREYAKNGYDLYLAARNTEELEAFANDVAIRTERTVKIEELDILNFESHQAFYDQLEEKPQGVISAVGYLGDQQKAQTDFNEAQRIIDTNYTGVVSLLNVVANDFKKRRSGFIVGISSVAGDRGRKSNYTYGSAKAALTAYLSGLRNDLYESQVHVMTVKPGFVATKMTEGMELPGWLTAGSDELAHDLYRAFCRKKDIVYLRWIWSYIIFVVVLIPERLFKKLSF